MEKISQWVRDEYEAALKAETEHDAPDARRVIREERCKLQTAMQQDGRHGCGAAEQARECRRVRLMWATGGISRRVFRAQ